MIATTAVPPAERGRGVDAGTRPDRSAAGVAAGGPLPTATGVAVIGSGFSGLALAVRLRRAGRTDFVVLERGDDVGGTWRDNSYPGCACDVPSHLYSFSFAPNPEWTSTFSSQAEIHAYLRDVATAEGVLPHIRFGAEMLNACWEAGAQRWRLATTRGQLTAQVLVVATGPLSEPAIPRLPGLEGFEGAVFHSASWDHEHDLDGERVAVVGTGASAIQFVPQIQPVVARLHLFQRTPPWVMPRRSRRLTRAERALYRRLPAAQRAMRAAIYAGRELYAVPLLHARLARAAARLARLHLRRQVRDPELRRRLTPAYAPGCKRVLISNDYYPALCQPNVEVVGEAIAEVRRGSVVTTTGIERAVDTLIFATGFHVTDMPVAERIRGAGGRSLAEVWDGSPVAHRGTTVAGFPNLFVMLGPNTGLGHTSVVVMAEAQADYIVDALRFMARAGVDAIEVREAVQAAWSERIQRAMRTTVWTTGGCASWYLDRAGRNTTLWPHLSVRFRLEQRRFDAESYASPPPPSAPAAGVAGALRPDAMGVA